MAKSSDLLSHLIPGYGLTEIVRKTPHAMCLRDMSVAQGTAKSSAKIKVGEVTFPH